jgi:hypothetical protein
MLVTFEIFGGLTVVALTDVPRAPSPGNPQPSHRFKPVLFFNFGTPPGDSEVILG